MVLSTLGLLCAACGGPPPATVALPTPQALQVRCASVPVDLSAQLWISGRDTPCALVVDVDSGTTSGSCDVAAGRERMLTVDWFVERQGERVLLAQARQLIDLAGATEEEQLVSISADDVTVTDCLDVREDRFDGSPTQRFGGAEVPVCDLDDSCGGDLQEGCSNLGEICAGTDPLVP